MEKTDKSVLEEASEIVNGPRKDNYGHPAINFARTATIWKVILGVEVTPRQVALCMIGVKLAREAHTPNRDNLVDTAGYAEVVRQIDEYDGEIPANLR